jgi:Na+-transporting methylmalonyl-CoA/oxaloacetate decarboxylase gamma subunit
MDHTCDWEIIQTAILTLLILFLWAMGILSIRKINRSIERYRSEAEEIKKGIADARVREKIDYLYQKAVKAMRKE